MTSAELDSLTRLGLLKAEPPDAVEFAGLVRSARARLRDAANLSLSPESRFDLAYNAAHALSLAALRWHGYRSAKRYAVFQALPHTLGLPPAVWRVLDRCHQIRNAVEYEGEGEIDGKLLTDLVAASELVQEAVERLGPIRSTPR